MNESISKIEIKNVSFDYINEKKRFPALQNINLEIHEGEFAVSVSLPEAVNMHTDLPADADPNKGFNYSYQLYHIVIR